MASPRVFVGTGEGISTEPLRGLRGQLPLCEETQNASCETLHPTLFSPQKAGTWLTIHINQPELLMTALKPLKTPLKGPEEPLSRQQTGRGCRCLHGSARIPPPERTRDSGKKPSNFVTV